VEGLRAVEAPAVQVYEGVGVRRYRLRIGDRLYQVRVLSEEQKRLLVEINGKTYEVETPDEFRWGEACTLKVCNKNCRVMINELKWTAPFQVYIDGKPITVQFETQRQKTTLETEPTAITKRPTTTYVSGAVVAPMPGRIVSIKVKKGDRVEEGDILLVLEAMKMENEITAPRKGTIKDIPVKEGASVNRGDPLIIID